MHVFNEFLKNSSLLSEYFSVSIYYLSLFDINVHFTLTLKKWEWVGDGIGTVPFNFRDTN